MSFVAEEAWAAVSFFPLSLAAKKAENCKRKVENKDLKRALRQRSF
jgi:hypothetical protein